MVAAAAGSVGGLGFGECECGLVAEGRCWGFGLMRVVIGRRSFEPGNVYVTRYCEIKGVACGQRWYLIVQTTERLTDEIGIHFDCSTSLSRLYCHRRRALK
jgi:hypothetical protein